MTARRRGRWLIYLAMLVAFIGAAFGTVLNLALPLYWQEHGQRYVTIISGSMVPTIEIGDQILITKRTESTRIRVGDVITYRTEGQDKPTSHRVVELVDVPSQPGQWYRTQGDANPSPDPALVSEGAVIGVMDRNLGPLGQMLEDAKTREWRLLYFAPALALMAALELANAWRRAPDRQEQTEVVAPPSAGAPVTEQ